MQSLPYPREVYDFLLKRVKPWTKGRFHTYICYGRPKGDGTEEEVWCKREAAAPESLENALSWHCDKAMTLIEKLQAEPRTRVKLRLAKKASEHAMYANLARITLNDREGKDINLDFPFPV